MAHRDLILKILSNGPAALQDLAGAAYPTLSISDAQRRATFDLRVLVAEGLVERTRRGYALSPLGQTFWGGIPLDIAQRTAETLIERLRPHAIRVEIAGSVRRRKSTVHDIEICALVRAEPHLLPSRPSPESAIHDALAQAAVRMRRRGLRHSSCEVAAGDHPVQVDLFVTADPDEWGMLYFIRTGSADFVRRALAYWKKISEGGECRGNRLYRGDGTLVPTPEEADVFAALGVKFVPPERRTPKKR